ncbi:DUF6013 family protein [Paraburkholderia sp.]|uniref:DUF6013 family protein n=1 Tax=Paraburkholderia sp. TaxID=1926495 RepID=UPI003D6E281F
MSPSSRLFAAPAVRIAASFAFSLAACPLVTLVALAPSAALAAPPIKITSQAATDGPIRYTVKVTSKQFGNAQDTRTIRSGESDDYTWKMVPPGGPVAAPEQCPDYSSLALDANGAMIRQIQVRLAPVVASDGTATVQLSFQAQTPHGTRAVTKSGKTLKCPNAVTTSQITRFTMPTNGSTKTLTLADSTQIAISARR